MTIAVREGNEECNVAKWMFREERDASISSGVGGGDGSGGGASGFGLGVVPIETRQNGNS